MVVGVVGISVLVSVALGGDDFRYHLAAKQAGHIGPQAVLSAGGFFGDFVRAGTIVTVIVVVMVNLRGFLKGEQPLSAAAPIQKSCSLGRSAVCRNGT